MDATESSSNESSNKPQIYQAAGRKGPGRYYYVATRKIVPGQVVKNGPPTFDIEKYELVPKPQRAAPVRVDYQKLRESEPGVVKRLTLLEINMLALQEDWRLTTRAQRAMSVWGKSRDELSQIFESYKKSYPDCNYLDYNPNTNDFVAKWRKPSEPRSVDSTPVPPSDDDAENPGDL